MKKIFIILLIFPIIMIFGCEMSSTSYEIDNIAIAKGSVKEKYAVNEFHISDLVIELKSGDKVIETIPATIDNISTYDIQKTYKIGEHTLTIWHENLKTSITINVFEKYVITFLDSYSTIIDKVEVLDGELSKEVPEVPSKLEYKGYWDFEDFENITEDITVRPYYVYQPELKIEEVCHMLDEQFTNYIVDGHFKFEKYIGNCTITWNLDSLYFEEDGTYKRPYTEESGTISFIVDDGVTKISKFYNVTYESYRSLSNGIASGYVFSNYPTLTNEFFETIDIIYCAFIMVDVDGNFIGLDSSKESVLNSNKSTLAKINSYVKPKARNSGSYVIASLGGGGDVMAETFEIIAASDTLRKNLAKNIVKMINEYGLDGVDVDWETPYYSTRKNFTLLMEEIYKAVKANNPNHLVTSAIGGGGWQPQLYDLGNSIKYLDYVNVMSYSMYSSSGFYQSSLYSTSSYYNSTYNCGRAVESVHSSIKTYNSLGVANSKLIIGAAFYGKKQIKKENIWYGAGSVNYNIIKRYRESGDFYSFYDEKAEVPFLLKKDGTVFISFDDERSIKAKCQYVLEQNLAGIMYWENGCDPTGDLVRAIKEGLNK